MRHLTLRAVRFGTCHPAEPFGRQRERYSLLTQAEIAWPKTGTNQAGSAMRPGTETVFLVATERVMNYIRWYSEFLAYGYSTHSHPDERPASAFRSLVFRLRHAASPA
jgi:hypothetical protein